MRNIKSSTTNYVVSAFSDELMRLGDELYAEASFKKATQDFRDAGADDYDFEFCFIDNDGRLRGRLRTGEIITVEKKTHVA